MPSPVTRAQDIAARLTAWGFTPRIARRADQIRIEAAVPHDVSAERWQGLLIALANGDRYGTTSTTDGLLAWVVVTQPSRRRTPPEGTATSYQGAE